MKRQEYLNELDSKLSKLNPADYEDTEDDAKKNEELKEKIRLIEEQIEANGKVGETEEIVKEVNEWTGMCV